VSPTDSPVPPRAALQEIYDGELGLRADNFSIKPVHVANGLGRALTGRTYNSIALQRALRRYVENQKAGKVREERHPTSAILESYPEAFQAGQGTDRERVNTLRTLSFGLLSADQGVYDDPDKSSYTLSNERFLTRDVSDYRAGTFLAALLTAGADGAAADLLRRLLTDEKDPYTTLAMPFLQLADVRDQSVVFDDHLQALTRVDTAGRLVSPTLRALREAFDRLAGFEEHQGSKLNSLRRLVLFGCFAIHVHVIHRWSEVSETAPRPPILADMFDGSRLPLRDASRATLVAGGDAITELVALRMRERFADLDENAASALLGHPAVTSDKKFSGVSESYAALRSTGEDIGVAMAEAYTQVAFRQDGGAPVGYLTELGRRAGYLTPWANQGRGGKTLKRYGLTAEFLETLVGATVDQDDPLTADQFLDLLGDRFGLVAGRSKDDAALRRSNLRDGSWGTPVAIAEEDLRMNVAELKTALVDTGYAKSYADGQTVVTANPDRATGL
jgi:hypothetical protein